MTRRQWPEYYDIEVFIEKEMGQWIGIYGYLCFVANTGTPEDGRIMSGLIVCIEEARRKDLSIA